MSIISYFPFNSWNNDIIYQVNLRDVCYEVVNKILVKGNWIPLQTNRSQSDQSTQITKLMEK